MILLICLFPYVQLVTDVTQNVGSWQLAVGSWQLAIGSWQEQVNNSPRRITYKNERVIKLW